MHLFVLLFDCSQCQLLLLAKLRLRQAYGPYVEGLTKIALSDHSSMEELIVQGTKV